MSPVAATIWLTSMIVGVLITLGGGTLWMYNVANGEHRSRRSA